MKTAITAARQLTGTTVMMLPITVIVDKPWTLPPVNFVTWGAVLELAAIDGRPFVFLRQLVRRRPVAECGTPDYYQGMDS